MAYRNKTTIDDQVEVAVSNKMKKALEGAINAKFIEEQKNLIIARTQLGVGVTPDGEAYKLPKLSESYKEQRQGKARWITVNGKKIKITKGQIRKPTLASTTQPAKSNLTATGQLLKSLTTVKLKYVGGIRWIIRISDNRGRDMNGRSSSIGNRQLNEYLEAQGRRFLGFTRGQKNEIIRKIRQILNRSIK